MTSLLAVVVSALLTASEGQRASVPAEELTASDRATVETEITVALVADVLPRRDVAELRSRLGVRLAGTPASRVSFTVDAEVDGLVADRQGDVRAARAEVRDAWIEGRFQSIDVRVGFGRLSWGRLDEIAPTDVINPVEAASFLLVGRSEARLPEAVGRLRWTVSDRARLEAVVAPVFRHGLFDRLAEDSSPFDLVADQARTYPGPVIRERREPETSWSNVSGGARADVTLGRLDLGLSAYRGFEALGPVVGELRPNGPLAPPTLALVALHPRFTMIGGDFETIRGQWAWRGEVAAFVDRRLADESGTALVAGRSVDAGIGVDRRVGASRVFGSAIWRREWSPVDAVRSRMDVSLVASVERAFARERYVGRVFVVANPADRSAFCRGLLAWKPGDRFAVEGSAGAFLGTSDDALGRFKTRDFLMATFRSWIG